VEHYVELPDLEVPKVRLRFGSREEIEDAALSVRRSWGLGDGPIEHVVRQLERHGVVTTRLALGRHDLDAYSVWFDDRPVVALGADKGSTARSRFDAAHELGHGVLHDRADLGLRETEDQAHRFAAAFLMPEDSIRSFLSPSVDWRELMNVKAAWGVSLAALLIRARDLRILSQARYVSAMKYMSAKGWRRTEPGDRALGAPEAPRLLGAALRRLKDQGQDLSSVTDEAGLPFDLISEVLAETMSGRSRVDL
jgi:Zn-dependent peptidase ImmA (M78 family)